MTKMKIKSKDYQVKRGEKISLKKRIEAGEARFPVEGSVSKFLEEQAAEPSELQSLHHAANRYAVLPGNICESTASVSDRNGA
jgi:hypothetical protein